jgi:hypothetical protein
MKRAASIKKKKSASKTSKAKTRAKPKAPAVKAKAKAKAKPARAAKAAKAPGVDADTVKAVRELDKTLRAYAPERHAALRGAKNFKKLEQLIAVPAALRALWSWADGSDELIASDPDEEHGLAMELFGVERAASELSGIRESIDDFPKDFVPFSGDGAGNYLSLDARGRVIDWDHETHDTRVVAKSLAALLRLTVRAMSKGNLFGGPEKRPGKPDPKVKRIDGLLAEPIKNYRAIIELSYRVAPPERYRVRAALRDAVLADNPSADRRSEILVSVADAASDAGLWDEALRSLADAGKGGVKVEEYQWAAVGRAAISAGAFEPASKAFTKVAGGHPEFAVEAQVGAALAAARTGGAARELASRAEKSVQKALAATEKGIAKEMTGDKKKPSATSLCDLSWFLNLRAALEQMRGDTARARATLREARTRCGTYFEVREMPLAAGLKESDAR